MPIFHVFDRVNYVRWASMYLEDMRNIESEHPAFYRHFVDVHFVVLRTQCKFNAVGADMGLEQTRQEEKPISLNGNCVTMKSLQLVKYYLQH